MQPHRLTSVGWLLIAAVFAFCAFVRLQMRTEQEATVSDSLDLNVGDEYSTKLSD